MKSLCRLILCALFYLEQLSVSNGTPLSASISPGATDMATLQAINVKCGRSGMTVHVTFDRPFTGVIYSKGNFYDPKCNYVPHGTHNQEEFSFLIPNDSCGTVGQLEDPTPERDMYFENTIVIQNDPLIQEVWDTARNLKCAWKHSFSKSVKTDPIEVEGPEMVNIDFDSRSVNTLMQIQKGKSPFSSPANGYIYIGDDTSLVIYIQDPTGGLDVNAVSCTASSGRSEPVELVDRNGCVTRPKLMTPFYKHKNPEGIDADLMLYSYFKAFRIGDDPNFKISCQLEVCEGSCLEPCALGPYNEFSRKKRDVSDGSGKKLILKIENNTLILSEFELYDEIQPSEDIKSKSEGSCNSEFGSVFTIIPILVPVSLFIAISGYLAINSQLSASERRISEKIEKIIKEISPDSKNISKDLQNSKASQTKQLVQVSRG